MESIVSMTGESDQFGELLKIKVSHAQIICLYKTTYNL